MRRNRWLRAGWIVLLVAGPCFAAMPLLKVAADRPDAVYRRGETVVFRIDAPRGTSVAYKLTKDGFSELGSGEMVVGDGPAEVKTSLDEAGVIHCQITGKIAAATQPAMALGGAAVDAETITPSLPVPEDFDAFWKKQKSRLEDEPALPVLTKVSTTQPSVDCFDVQVNCPGGAPLSGYLAMPKDARPHSLPAILYPHSAGVRDSDLPHAIKGAKMGLLAFDFNAHGLPNGKGDKFYAEQNNGALRGYAAIGSNDREKIYFLGMYLRLMRAIDFVASRPEWNGKILIVEGSSQGGGQALVAAGLDPRITLCLASVPALCDHTGFVANRASGWPRIVPKDASGKYDEKVKEAARYIDAMNFATRIKCPTYVTVGYIDKTCAATSVFAAYNNIPTGTEKHIIPRTNMGHAFPPDLIARYDEIIRAHIQQ